MKNTITALSLLLIAPALAEAVVESSNCLNDLFSKRSSGYSYDAGKNVTPQQLALIFEAGQSAPSCYNEQPWRFLVCDKTTNPESYNKLLSTLVEFNQGWAKNAPLLVAVVAHTEWTRGGANQWGEYDTGAASFGMALEATSLGLMAHQMGGFDAAKIKKLFSIPDGFAPISVMAIGYPSADQKALERKRKPINENFFMGSWEGK